MFSLLTLISAGVIAKSVAKDCWNRGAQPVTRPAKIYPEPHRTPDGKILIENCEQYNADLLTYGYAKVRDWVNQGRYNLTPEEAERRRKKREEEKKKLTIEYMVQKEYEERLAKEGYTQMFKPGYRIKKSEPKPVESEVKSEVNTESESAVE